MTEDFLTEGLQSDRYLKAFQLVDQFEEEIEETLLGVGRRMTEQHPELFDANSDPETKSDRSPYVGFATHRSYHPMNDVQPSEPDKTPKLNVHLYWMPPTEYGRTDIDGALRGFGYKIKYADESIDDLVAEQTRTGDWPLEISGNPYDSNNVFYRHVSSVADIEETMETLVDHFSTFGGEYAVASADQ